MSALHGFFGTPCRRLGLLCLGLRRLKLQGPELEADVIPFHGDEGAGGVFHPGAAIDVENAVVLGDHGQVGVAAGDVVVALGAGIVDGAGAR